MSLRTPAVLQQCLLVVVLLSGCAPSAPIGGDNARGFSLDAGPDAGGADAGGSEGLSDAGAPDAGGLGTGPFFFLGQCPSYAGARCVFSFIRGAIGSESVETVTAFNQGDATLHLHSATLIPDSGTPFLLETAFPMVVAAKDSAVISLRFRPSQAGTFRASLTLQSDSFGAASVVVPVEGGTRGASCQAKADCLLDEYCSPDTQTCSTCISLVLPRCEGGRLISKTDEQGCPQPTCVCPDKQVYVQGRCTPSPADAGP